MPTNTNPKILIRELAPQDNAYLFSVEVAEEGSATTHRVTLDKEYYARIAKGTIKPEELIRKSFEFLLEREPKESILREFTLSDIQRYFPEYEQAISARQ